MSQQALLLPELRSIRPFLKWAGGKYRLLERILPLLPEGRRFFEPFVGSGAVFLNTCYDEYCLSDINQDLINLYKTLQQHSEEFISFAGSFFTSENNSRPCYEELRDRFNSTRDVVEKSALFIYLNRHCFNGLTRYNLSGKFNVPFGRYAQPYFPSEEMRQFVEKSKRAIFATADFRRAMPRAQAGDLVYADPPYVPLSKTSNFTGYHGKEFRPNDQHDLAELAIEVSQRSIPVLISNHDTDFTRHLYEGARVVSFPVQRNISCKGDKRKKVMELLALFVPPLQAAASEAGR